MLNYPFSEHPDEALTRNYFQHLFDLRVSLVEAFVQGFSRQNRGGRDHHNHNIHQHDLDDKNDEGQDKYVKGLKELSKKVKEAVSNSEPLTYKDVANKLIVDSEQYLQSLETEERDKEEKNIKRRVYDALNVLIASGVLIKKGKRVSAKITKLHAKTLELTRKIEEIEKSMAAKQARIGQLKELAGKVAEFAKRRNETPVDPDRKLVFPRLALVVSAENQFSWGKARELSTLMPCEKTIDRNAESVEDEEQELRKEEKSPVKAERLYETPKSKVDASENGIEVSNNVSAQHGSPDDYINTDGCEVKLNIEDPVHNTLDSKGKESVKESMELENNQMKVQAPVQESSSPQALCLVVKSKEKIITLDELDILQRLV